MKMSSRRAAAAALAAAGLLGASMARLASAQTPAAPRPPDYAGVIRALEAFIEDERTDKQLPAISIALVDGTTIIWSRGS